MCNVVSRSTDHLDVFVCDGAGSTLTAAWEPAMVSWWEGWWGLLGGRAAPGAAVTAVSRRKDFLDVFVGRHRRWCLHLRVGAGPGLARLVAHRQRRVPARAR